MIIHFSEADFILQVMTDLKIRFFINQILIH